MFNKIAEDLTALPGILVLLPAIMSMRGNVSSSYGARLATAYHLGLITPKTGFNDEAMENAKASIFLSGVTSIYVGIVAWGLTVLFNLPHMPLLNFVLISFLVSIISETLLVSFSYFVAMSAVRLSLNPNSVTVPSIATLGDIITLSTTFAIARLLITVGIV